MERAQRDVMETVVAAYVFIEKKVVAKSGSDYLTLSSPQVKATLSR